MTKPRNPSETSSDSINWTAILDSIEAEKCIICLGPGMFVNNGKDLEDQLIDYLKPKAKELKIRIYDDGRIHYLPGYNIIEPYQKVKEFYQKEIAGAKTILSELTDIPIHLYISSTPDYHLRNAFIEKELPHNFDSYRKKKPYKKNAPLPSMRIPLIYNLLGEANNRHSLILTHDDFFEYLESVFEGKSMAVDLKSTIQNKADNFLFLGLPFDKWYMHLFLRILNQHRNKNLLKYAPSLSYDQSIKTHCEDQFNITIVPKKIGAFITELHNKCRERGMLRSMQSNAKEQTFDGKQILYLIGKGMVGKALVKLEKDIEETPYEEVFERRVIILKSELSHLNKKEQNNRITQEQYQVGLNEISHQLIDLVRDIENHRFL